MANVLGLFLVLSYAFCSASMVDQRLELDLNETSSSSEVNLHEEYFQQKLDHDSDNMDTWSQRYWYSSSSSKNATKNIALLFIYGAPAATLSTDSIDRILLKPLGDELNATRFYLEHRFYGKSRPKNDTSLESLIYLSSKQAIADIAHFIDTINKQQGFPVNMSWVVFGISYGGSLATWARMKYPDLIFCAISINAPMLAKADFSEYYENVVNSINTYNQECAQKIKSANQDLDRKIKSEGVKDIIQMFQLCENSIKDSDDVSLLFAELAGNLAKVVEQDTANLIKMKNNTGIHTTVAHLCEIMLKPNSSPLHSYAEVNKVMMGRIKPMQKCFNHSFKSEINELKKTEYGDPETIGRQWIYQLCTEFGFFQSSDKTSEVFGNSFPLTLFVKRCQELFGSKLNISNIEEKISSTNEQYGGLNPAVNRTMFFYSSENPWRSLFVTRNKTDFYDVFELHETLQDFDDLMSFNMWSFSALFRCIEKFVGCTIMNGANCY